MQSIILIDHESNDLFIAEIKNNTDIEKIKIENKKLNDEYYENENTERDDYYLELQNRTWIKIYKADFLYV